MDDFDMMEFNRVPMERADECDACGSFTVSPGGTFFLEVYLNKNTLTLCPTHEGELLTKLLTNYLKRRGKGSKVGFVEGLRKSDSLLEDPTLEDLPEFQKSAAEKLKEKA